MNKLYLLYVMSISVPCALEAEETLPSKFDRSYCNQRLVGAAGQASNTQAIRDIMVVIKECPGSKQDQLQKAHELAVKEQNKVAAWRLGVQAGREESKWWYHGWTAAWTFGTAVAAIAMCRSTGLCESKK